MPLREHIEGLHATSHFSGNRIMPDMHSHNAYEIFILEEGDRSYVVEDKLVYLRPRDVILLKPDVIHCGVGGTYICSPLEIPESYLARFFTDYGIELITKCFDKNVIRVRQSDFEQLLSCVEKLSVDNEDISSLVQLLTILENNMSRVTYDLQNTGSIASDVVDYITENYKTIDKLDTIADRFYISKQYLCNLFKQHTGTSIIKYINILKIHASFELLSQKNLTMAEIAEKSGFSSLSYFSKTFKSVTGVSPLKYSKIGSADRSDSI